MFETKNEESSRYILTSIEELTAFILKVPYQDFPVLEMP